MEWQQQTRLPPLTNLDNVFRDQLAMLRALGAALATQQIASRQVHEAELVGDFAALRALAGAGSAEDKNDERMVLLQKVQSDMVRFKY